MNMRCIASEENVAHLELPIDAVGNMECRFPNGRASGFDVCDFFQSIFLRAYDSPNRILFGRFGDVVNDAYEEDESIAVEKKDVTQIFLKWR